MSEGKEEIVRLVFLITSHYVFETSFSSLSRDLNLDLGLSLSSEEL